MLPHQQSKVKDENEEGKETNTSHNKKMPTTKHWTTEPNGEVNVKVITNKRAGDKLSRFLVLDDAVRTSLSYTDYG